MLRNRRRAAENESGPEPRAAAVRQAAATDSEIASPARALQDFVEVGLAARAHDDGRRWSPRATLALAGGVSLLVWAALAIGVAAVL